MAFFLHFHSPLPHGFVRRTCYKQRVNIVQAGANVSAKIIDGKAYAEGLATKIQTQVVAFKAQSGRVPGLAVVLVGQDPASEIYVRSKVKKTTELGMKSFEHVLPDTATQEELLRVVAELNANNEIDGILVQMPLPKQIDELTVISAISPAKDVDGLHPENAGRLVAGLPCFVSCTPLGCLMLLKDQLGDLTGMNAIVIGRSLLVGKPMAQLLLNENCTVTMAHSRTRDLADKVRQADIVVAAVGKAEMVKAAWVKPGATVIDVGTTRVVVDGKKKLVGDVDFAAVQAVAGALTPVPGGVGPMTIMTLMHNTVIAAYRRQGLPVPKMF
ncbi:MAG: bifunctional methylenetetrahydrofolate dehydrogenase/methenyltetrahydrofolate cyclohydrolase FolD [Alphaproteobacteria bacterium]|nr:bifunctional methylenetetrahydrofolate dehydrogenase/methenyltetrahydrofolate cyclohydrolase FolD [Alphaproteobacteria bacterium]MBV8548928.1 bifunctional methylenetetrahydrofolate dehydrogenase/methenyltetrahydrofolate cyclohydrolase FolD [Alphaproteobacteria bacterium]